MVHLPPSPTSHMQAIWDLQSLLPQAKAQLPGAPSTASFPSEPTDTNPSKQPSAALPPSLAHAATAPNTGASAATTNSTNVPSGEGTASNLHGNLVFCPLYVHPFESVCVYAYACMCVCLSVSTCTFSEYV